MRENAGNMNEEDRAALELILQQEAQPSLATQYAGDEGDTGGQAGPGLDENSDSWSYDQLLALGEALGGEWAVAIHNRRCGSM